MNARWVGVSLKLYLGVEATREWLAAVGGEIDARPSLALAGVAVAVMPSLPSVHDAVSALAHRGVAVGAQNVHWEDRGAYTGEVSATDLADIGCTIVEVGHCERRRLFGETDALVAKRVAAAIRNSLTPVVCIGEADRMDIEAAGRESVRQLDAALADTPGEAAIVVAYEPQWAIGADRPASDAHIAGVVSALRARLAAEPRLAGSLVVYGGSAGPGLLTRLGGAVDGLFLGRFAHDPAALGAVLDEAIAGSRR